MPVRGVGLRAPVPDLAQIHPDRWREVLLPLDRVARTRTALNPLLKSTAAWDLMISLPQSPSEAACAAMNRSPGVPVPTAEPPRAGRQVNVRIPNDDWEALQRAAHILGARPSQLVRMLVLNGVRRVLAEHDAAIAAAGTATST